VAYLIKKNRFWSIMVGQDGLTKEYGTIGGKVTTSRRVVKPKGGRTLSEQLTLEIASAISKQRDKGYHSPTEDPPTTILPMLAKPYDPARITFPVALQEKLNGVRCVAERRGEIITLTTRKGKPVTSMGHVREALLDVMQNGERWDGELFCRSLSLQEISGLVRKKEATPQCRMIEFWHYDHIADGSFRERFMGHYMPETSFSRKVPTYTANTVEGIDLYYESIVGQGGEGIVVRNPDAPYQMDKRTWDLMKRKEFHDQEFDIVDWKVDVDGCVYWVCATKECHFNVVPTGTKESRRVKQMKPWGYVGLPLTVRYSELSDDGIPQGNPVGVAIRNYE